MPAPFMPRKLPPLAAGLMLLLLARPLGPSLEPGGWEFECAIGLCARFC